MSIQSRPDGLVFADSAKSGEVINFPEIARGWGVSFDQTEGIPPMEWFNSLFQRQDKAIKYLLQQGIVEWSNTEEYPKDAIVKHGGKTWQAIKKNKGSTPQASSVDWVSFADTERVMNSYSTTPTTKQGKIIYVDDIGVMKWDGSKYIDVDIYQKKSNQVGNLIPHFGIVPPEGTLVCDGGEVSRITYASLFNVVNTIYGSGDGLTTFNLPNFSDGDAILAGSEANVGMATAGEVISHLHSFGYASHGYDYNKYQSKEVVPNSGTNAVTRATGGNKNLAAGLKILICIRY